MKGRVLLIALIVGAVALIVVTFLLRDRLAIAAVASGVHWLGDTGRAVLQLGRGECALQDHAASRASATQSQRLRVAWLAVSLGADCPDVSVTIGELQRETPGTRLALVDDLYDRGWARDTMTCWVIAEHDIDDARTTLAMWYFRRELGFGRYDKAGCFSASADLRAEFRESIRDQLAQREMAASDDS